MCACQKHSRLRGVSRPNSPSPVPDHPPHLHHRLEHLARQPSQFWGRCRRSRRRGHIRFRCPIWSRPWDNTNGSLTTSIFGPRLAARRALLKFTKHPEKAVELGNLCNLKGLSQAYCGRTLTTFTIFTTGSSIWPFITPPPLVGDRGDAKIACTTSIPSTTSPNGAKPAELAVASK